MNLLKRSICIFLTAIIAVGLTACSGQKNSNNKSTSSKKQSSSSLDETNAPDTDLPVFEGDTAIWDDNTNLPSAPWEINQGSGRTGYTGERNNGSTGTKTTHRAPYEKQQETVAEKFVDTDGNFLYQTVTWDGPEGYTIVVPSGNNEAKKAANQLHAFFAKQSNVDLAIVEDTTAETPKEILIGKTNRNQSQKTMDAAQLAASVKDGKLIFDGGHDVTVRAAVDKFIRLAPAKGKAVTFNLTSDFKSTLPDGYQYVWGDEFEGDDIDLSKWDFDHLMNGTNMVEISYGKDVINVSDGRLKLFGLRYFNPERAGTQFKVPYSVISKYKMNYLYGYVEIRARVPFCKGAWPSFWAQTTDYLSGKVNEKYMTEIDIFEGFGNPTVFFNLHKWYRYTYDFDAIYGVNAGQHTMYNSGAYKKSNTTYTFENADELDNEYHVYGFEWTPTYMAASVDGTVFSKVDITKSYDECEDFGGFHDPIFLMFNNYVMTIDTDSQSTYITNSLDKLPTCYFIDYIRLYQKPGVGEFYMSDKISHYPARD